MKFPNNTDDFAYRLAELVKHSEARDFRVAVDRERVKRDRIVTIEYWWNRSARIWTMQYKNVDGYQIGAAEFSGTRPGIETYVAQARLSYPSATVVKS